MLCPCAAAGMAQQQGRQQRDVLALQNLARDERDRLVAIALKELG